MLRLSDKSIFNFPGDRKTEGLKNVHFLLQNYSRLTTTIQSDLLGLQVTVF